jgi:hypothetical protein
MYANAFKSGVLKEEVHGRLVQNLDAYARDAGIQPRWVWTPLAATCGQVEVNYVRQYPTHRAEGLVSGLLYLRDASAEFPNVDERMSAIAGAFTRNFIRARVMTLSMVLDHISDGEPVGATILLIPNFCLSKVEGGDLPAWKAATVYDLLLKRRAENLHTILYASSMGDVIKFYGTACSHMLDSHFLKVMI